MPPIWSCFELTANGGLVSHITVSGENPATDPVVDESCWDSVLFGGTGNLLVGNLNLCQGA